MAVFRKCRTSYKNIEKHVGNTNPVKEKATLVFRTIKLNVSRQGKKYVNDLTGAKYNKKHADLHKRTASVFSLFVTIGQVALRMVKQNKASVVTRKKILEFVQMKKMEIEFKIKMADKK